MGTLDPQGTGVLLAGVGKCARLFDYYLKKDKTYEAEFTFGYTTDTLDADGHISGNTDVLPDKAAVIGALAGFTGVINQLPPSYSAKSIGGVRAYAIARAGGEPQLTAVPVTVHEFSLIQQTAPNVYTFLIRCSGGTYIRSLCRDLAVRLNSLACMTAIHRSAVGAFTDKTAVSLAQLEQLKESALISPETALAHLPRRDFPDEAYQKILNGIKLNTPPADAPFTVYCQNELFGIGKAQDGFLKITTFLKD